MGEFPSGQRGQTVNLLSMTSLVRIQLPPPEKALAKSKCLFLFQWFFGSFPARIQFFNAFFTHFLLAYYAW